MFFKKIRDIILKVKDNVYFNFIIEMWKWCICLIIELEDYVNYDVI